MRVWLCAARMRVPISLNFEYAMSVGIVVGAVTAAVAGAGGGAGGDANLSVGGGAGSGVDVGVGAGVSAWASVYGFADAHVHENMGVAAMRIWVLMPCAYGSCVQAHIDMCVWIARACVCA
jgi:hypothetical protein